MDGGRLSTAPTLACRGEYLAGSSARQLGNEGSWTRPAVVWREQLLRVKEQKPGSKKQPGSVESEEEGDRCLREEGGQKRQLRAWRVAGPGFGPPHTNPTRSLCHPPRLLLLLLSTRAAGGSGREDAYIGEEERPVARSRPAKVTICSGGVVRGGPLGQEGETGQLDGSSVTENR